MRRVDDAPLLRSDEVVAMADAFAAYEARQLTAAIRQSDMDPDELPFDWDGSSVSADDLPDDLVLDSLHQHPDEYLPDTVGRPDLEAATIREALTEHFGDDQP